MVGENPGVQNSPKKEFQHGSVQCSLNGILTWEELILSAWPNLQRGILVSSDGCFNCAANYGEEVSVDMI